MQTAPDNLQAIKERMKATWMAGDFGQVARYSAAEAEKFVARLNIKPGMRVLDVACGTGNLAIPAARAGAVVTGVDIASNLVAQARQRAAEEKLSTKFDEGDAEQLPYPDNHFDVVMSMFGAMFAPRPERVAAELLRVCRPGGLIAMANWTPRGLPGRMFALSAKHVPPPEGIPPSALWGDEATVRQRFGSRVSKLEMRPFLLEFDYPMGPAKVVEFFRTYFGPTQVAFSRLAGDKQKAYADELTNLWIENNEAAGDRTQVKSEYLEVRATKA
jgi:ubiquinone/menaquinone biosynthesis C-methylase UbiE